MNMNRIGSMQDSMTLSTQEDIGVDEFSIVLHSSNSDTFEEQLADLNAQLESNLNARGLTTEALVFCRFFLSDMSTQSKALLASSLYRQFSSSCCSIVGQAPLGAGDIALQAYCLQGKAIRKDVIARLETDGYSAVKVETGNYEFLWTGGMTSTDQGGSFDQTNEIFQNYESLLKTYGFNLNPDTLRTWIFVDDVDNNYGGMVDARRLYFEEKRLTKDTHYLASTGIEANLPVAGAIVAMDAIAAKRLSADQVTFMQAPDNMCPTHIYNVTFERGTEVTYGDRKHIYVSGTASIDINGDVLHIDDVSSQTQRTIDNVEALLSPYDAELNQAAYLLIYLRNSQDYAAVKAVVDERVPDSIPRIFLKGPVCRPTWLVEIEGFFITPAASAHHPL